MHDSGTLVACDVRAGRVALLQRHRRVAAARATCTSSTCRRTDRCRSRRVRSRARGRALLRPRHDPPRSRHPLAAARGDLPRSRAQQVDLLIARRGRRRAGRPAGVRHVLERARGERGRGRGVPRAGADSIALDLRSESPRPLQPLLDDRGMLRTLPFAHGLEAFFAAAMVRRRR